MTDLKKLGPYKVSIFKLTCCLSSLCDKMTAKSRRLNTIVRTHMAKRALEIPVEPPVRYFELAECIFRNPWFCLLREELFWEALPRSRKHALKMGMVWIAFQSPPSIYISPLKFWSHLRWLRLYLSMDRFGFHQESWQAAARQRQGNRHKAIGWDSYQARCKCQLIINIKSILGLNLRLSSTLWLTNQWHPMLIIGGFMR